MDGTAGTSPAPDLVTLARRAARLWGERTAVSFPATGEALSFAGLQAESERLAGGLAARGVRPGDRVAVMLPNRPEFPLLWLAIATAGATMVPVNVSYREADAAFVLNHSGAELVITDQPRLALMDRLLRATPLAGVISVDSAYDGVDDLSAVAAVARGRSLPTVHAEQPANLQYTSGTTGHPKGCVLSHFYWCRLAARIVAGPPQLAADDVMLTAQPFYYMDPQWNLAASLQSGARLVVLDGFHPSSFWDHVRAEGATFFYCLGMMPRALYNMPPSPLDRAHRVRGILCSAIPKDLHGRLEERWGVPWYEAFGMTETGGDLRVGDADRPEVEGTGCIGRPYPDRELRVLDEHGDPLPRGEVGEMVLRGPGMMDRYHADAPATEVAFRGGWFHTGDLVSQDEEGRVYYVGRIKDMIRRSGENIAASEVEAVLCGHPAVAEAACVAVPDTLRGEEVKVYVVAAGPRPEPGQLHAWLLGQLAYFKVPRYWAYVEHLPRTPSEKIAKGDLISGVDDLRDGAWDAAEGRWRTR